MECVYKCSDVAERIKFEFDKRGLKPSPTMREIGLGENSLRNFKTSMPSAGSLAMIADYLNVSVDYLLGRQQAVPAVAPADDVSRLVAIYKKLSPEKQEFLMKQAEMYLDAEDNKKAANSDLV